MRKSLISMREARSHGCYTNLPKSVRGVTQFIEQDTSDDADEVRGGSVVCCDIK
jgi:hypothetical protein